MHHKYPHNLRNYLRNPLHYGTSRLLAVLTACLLLTSPVQATDKPAYSDPAFGAAVRAYLLNNPEILLELAAKLENGRLAAQQAVDIDLIKAQATALFADKRDGRMGNGTPVMVEFLDYNCGYCRRNHAAVTAYNAAHPDKAIILKEFPILGAGSEAAARAALAVKALHGNRAYLAIHNAFLQMNGPLDENSITALFAEFEWDAATIKAEMQSDAITAHINDNQDLARAIGVTGTPGFVFHTHIARGLQSLTQLKAATSQTDTGKHESEPDV